MPLEFHLYFKHANASMHDFLCGIGQRTICAMMHRSLHHGIHKLMLKEKVALTSEL
jgi:hypothetical protein